MTETELERLARAATPGPWFVDKRRRSGERAYAVWGPDGIGGGTVADCTGATLAYRHDNAAYIAAASPDRVLTLISRIRELEEALREFVRIDGFISMHEMFARDWEPAIDRARALLPESNS